MIEIRKIKLPLSYTERELISAAADKLGVGHSRIKNVKLLKRSLDARRKGNLHFIASAAVAVSDESGLLRKNKNPDVLYYTEHKRFAMPRFTSAPELRPVVCGAGPAGLFAALTLAEAGAAPVLIERGEDVDARSLAVARFNASGELDRESNVQFGEGGAGTFSDGKLTTNISDPLCAHVLRVFVEAGAPEEILWLSKPHIGTDLLPGVVRGVRERIIAAGGEVLFGTRLVGIDAEGGRVHGIRVRREDRDFEFDTSALLLAAGHSARDVFALLHDLGASLERKAFSLGVRIEHPQVLINTSQYGAPEVTPLGAADYKLSCHLKNGRGVYTFCMCPGGAVVAAASDHGGVVTNGMSRYSRDGENANSAFLVGVTPEDFDGSHPLAGVFFQQRYEAAAYTLGGRSFRAPAQLLADFIKGVPSLGAGEVRPTYPLGVEYCDLAQCLPDFAAESLRAAVPVFDAKLRGFALPDAVLTGVETRSSSPVRILRDRTFQSNIRGLFPCGEGAGYAGGIMSAAVDGIKTAQAAAKALGVENGEF